MSIWEKIKKTQVTIGLFFAILLLIPFQLLLLYSSFSTPANLTLPLMLNSKGYQFLLGYFALTIIYCIVVSLMFHPKCIVSPIYVQIGTAVVFSIFSIYSMLLAKSVEPSELYQHILDVSVAIATVIVLLISIGFLQLIIVRWVVALNFDSVDRLSYKIKMTPTEFLKALGDILHDIWGFNRRKDNPQAKENIIWVLKRHDQSGNSVVLTVGSAPDDANKSILATVAYHASSLAISKSNDATEIRNSIINDIEKRLKKSNSKLRLTPMDEVNDSVSFKAYSHAVMVTQSKIESTRRFLRVIPRYYLYAITITIIALGITTFAHFLGIFDIGTYAGIVMVVVVALIIELGVSLRAELSHQKIEELE